MLFGNVAYSLIFDIWKCCVLFNLKFGQFVWKSTGSHIIKSYGKQLALGIHFKLAQFSPATAASGLR